MHLHHFIPARLTPALSLLIPAVLGAGLGLIVVACQKEKLPQAKTAQASTQRTLKLEAYTPPIPVAPAQGAKLETSVPHPVQLAQAQAETPTLTVERPSATPAAPKPAAAPPLRARYSEPAENDVPPLPQRFRRFAYQDQPPPADPNYGRYVEAPGYTGHAPGDPRFDDPAPPSGFRLNAQMCRRAARMGDPLAQTQECVGILQAAEAQLNACRRAFDVGDDQVAMSPQCRQAAMGR